MGFTLLELVIALSLSSIILFSGTYLFSTFFRTYKLESKKAEEIQIHQMVLRKIAKDARSANKVSLDGQKLVILYNDHTISYEFINNKAKRQKGNSSAYLTDNNEISSLNFSITKPGLVKIKTNLFETEVFCRNGQ